LVICHKKRNAAVNHRSILKAKQVQAKSRSRYFAQAAHKLTDA
jgi:hypothetical protein